MSSLDPFFKPRGIAVIGASARPGSVGYVIVEQLKKRFKGAIYPVNPRYTEILGLKCYPTVEEVPDPVDLAVIAVRAEIVPQVMESVGKRGIRAAIIVSGGFAEIGPEGEERQRKVVEIAQRYGIRVIGPNCIGVLDNSSGVDTFFLPEDRLRRPVKGCISIVSQSGALLAMWIDWMAMKGMGLAKAVSYGNKVDVDDVDLIEYLAEDPDTKVILLYIEGLKPGRGRAFIDAVRKAIARGKPVVALKGGKTERGVRAAASHTAAIASGYEIYQAMFRQAGVIEAETMEELFDIAKALTMMPPARGRRLLIVTNAGGEGVLATDYATRYGLEVPILPKELREELRKVMPQHVIVDNPIDLTGDTDDERYRIALEAVLSRDVVDMAMVIAPPHPPAMTERVVEYIAEVYREFKLPILVVVTGGYIAEKYMRKFESVGLPTYPTPERAARAAAALAVFGEILRRYARR